MRIIIISKEHLFREVLARHLGVNEEKAEVVICGQADLLGAVDNFAPDLIVLDVTSEKLLAEVPKINDIYPGTSILALLPPKTQEEVVDHSNTSQMICLSRQASLDELNKAINSIREEKKTTSRIKVSQIKGNENSDAETSQTSPPPLTTVEVVFSQSIEKEMLMTQDPYHWDDDSKSAIAALKTQEVFEIFNYYDSRSNSVKGRAWTITAWILTLDAGLFAFSHALYFKESASWLVFLILQAIIALVGLALCSFNYVFLHDHANHLTYYWTIGNKIAAWNKSSRGIVFTDKERHKVAQQDYEPNDPPGFIKRLMLLNWFFVGGFIVNFIFWLYIGLRWPQ